MEAFFYYNLRSFNLQPITFFIRKQLGLLDISKREPNSYVFKQIVEYSEDDLLEHLKKHEIDFEGEEKIEGVFSNTFPLIDIVHEIEKYIPSEKRVFTDLFTNRYLFK